MNNEELAAQAKAGDKEARFQLWEQNGGLLAVLFRNLMARPHMLERMAAAGVTTEDVEQAGFLAIADAVRLYNPDKGLFSSYLGYTVKAAFYDLLGLHTKRGTHDTLNNCTSLDEPISDEDSTTTRSELVPDTTASTAFQDAEDRLYNEHLHKTLDDLLARLEQPQEAVLKGYYYKGQTLKQLAAAFNVSPSRIHELKNSGLRRLQGYHRILSCFRENAINTKAYHGTGFQAWKNGGSVEERVVVWMDEHGL